MCYVIIVIPQEPTIPRRPIDEDRYGGQKQAENPGTTAGRKDEFRNLAEDCYIRRHFENTQCNENR
jgi:hypothetical protein